MKKLAALPLILLFVAPLVATLAFALASSFDAAAWTAVLRHPQFAGGLELSFATGSSATFVSLVLAIWIARSFYEQRRIDKLVPMLSAMLAVPHLAFAIGFGFIIMPTGFLARLIAVPAGWTDPPRWMSSHDTYGIALTIALIAKETAFLLFVLVGVFSREDVKQSFHTQQLSALSLGHASPSIWLRLFLPQLVQHLFWPLVIVFVYATTVVDMSLVLGPTQPPVFADVIWADVNSADPINNARGNAGAMLISLLAGAVLAVIYFATKAMLPIFKRWITRGPGHTSVKSPHPAFGHAKWQALKLIYIFVIGTLIILSFAGLWAFPQLLPEVWNVDAWLNVAAHASPLITSLALASTTSLTGLLVLIIWLENVPKRFDRFTLVLSVLVLGLPALLTGLGQYQVFLRLNLTGTFIGLFLAHLMPVVAYMFIMLNGPYRSFESKWRDAATGLMSSPLHFLTHIKWPMLKAPLLSSLAVGFAVSFAQFVPAQLVAAGRYSTLPMEAVTLSSGSNRALTAAFALLLMVPPLLIFLTSGLLSRPRWGNA